ncbi:hypothetical protein, unknown function [Leishmania mexicana MHOM/GT/2001/U1103]|uniref:Uncharacterized protein n=1 Tax=Leishmania mexicana (strain MHOM/GT/2001/U1103) TaxID=929439 RepID=E9B221_LEIMU|nr:hypothetical protein, unknown function [Leishmania mexicana MHOM/GT/2001/U1103]CBZ29278.1 hypothetical protein, unknown function [Leishmania mexicana MHOM/GT/2001/U1103]
MGVTCTRENDVVSSSAVTRMGLTRRCSHLESTRHPSTFTGKTSRRHRSPTHARADVCVGCDNSCEALCAVESVPLSVSEPMGATLLPSCAERLSSNRSFCNGSTAETTVPHTSLVADTPTAPRYSMYHIPDEENDNGYTLTPFKSIYCLPRTAELEPNNFRAVVTHSHAAAAAVPSTETAAYSPKGDDGGEKKGAVSQETMSCKAFGTEARTFSRQSHKALWRGFSFGIASDCTDDLVWRHADETSCMSSVESGLVLQPESRTDSASCWEVSSIFPRATICTEADESSSTVLTSQSTLSRRHTFGVMMPTGHSQVVEHTEDGGAWEPALASPSVCLDARRSWQKQKGSMTVTNVVEEEEGQGGAFALQDRHHHRHHVGRHYHLARAPAVVPPCASSHARSKVGRQWPQPIMEGPKSNLSRSRPFNVEATLGYSARSARFVPSPDWGRICVSEEEKRRLTQVLVAQQQHAKKWKRAQAARWNFVSL